MGIRFKYLRRRMPQMDGDDYQRQLSQALHEHERDMLRAFTELDCAPVLKVARITSDQSLTAANLTTVQFNSTVVDTHSWWDSSTHLYTPQFPGFYRCSWMLNFHDTAAFATSTYGYSQVNTTDLAINYGNGAALDIETCGSTIVECNGVSDTIGLKAYILTGTAPTVFSGSSPYRSWMTVDYLGRRSL